MLLPLLLLKLSVFLHHTSIPELFQVVPDLSKVNIWNLFRTRTYFSWWISFLSCNQQHEI